MSSQEIQDYITESLNKQRYCHRAFFINVNIAKNELVKFHASCDVSLLSGDFKPSLFYDDEDTMDVDDHGLSCDKVAETEEDSEEPIRTAIMLVSERDLEDTSRFAHVHAQTIQCLSPSPVNDGNVLCPLTDNIRGVKVPKPLAKLPAVPKPGFRLPAKTNIEEPKAKGKEKEKEKQIVVKTEKGAEKVKVAPKATGKLDFSKAKTKEMKEKEREEKKADAVKMRAKTAAAKETKSRAFKEERDTESHFFLRGRSCPYASVDASDTKARKEVKEEPKRGIKRKSPAGAEPDRSTSDDEPSTSKAPQTRIVKGSILSDDDDDDDIPLCSVKNLRRKSRASSAASATSVPDSEAPSETEADAGNSEAERVLRAMMDIDDVDRAHPEALEQEEEEEEEPPFDDDVAMSDSDVPKPKPRARKTKKVIPVGSNGLKKKRVMKTEKFVDDKGYMITREVSDYESVDETEAPPVKAKKVSKSKTKAKDKHDSDDSDNADDDVDAKVKSDSKGKTKAEAGKPVPADVKREDGVVLKNEAPTVKKAPSRKGLKGGSKGKTQQKSLMTFFGPPK
ncbi:hypothetical protein BDN71DRAFT_1455661 [Pleurotus eryngii]|uniref:DNA polymerase delta subunit 3 n=1 Tax=Pleurotus eryngii TaxID=5323 RepID=A0A9P5ZN98_PLEER|nr:hypothetical protein BDN71DRAFT_1455661 [Pleurotus eryngii]